MSRRFLLVPHEDILIASDSPLGSVGELYVPEVARSSATLAKLTVRQPVRQALDVGTGNGIQAVLAARHAERVVATDTNERALRFTEFNAALNLLDNIEVRSGNLFEPVAGERFDLVVSNLPFVISPDSEFVFRDSAIGRDGVSERFVAELPNVLADGAYASVGVSWIVDGEDPAARPAAWAREAGLHACILYEEPTDALTHAAAWNDALAHDAELFTATIERWLAYYAAEGIERIALGTMVLRDAGGAEPQSTARRLPSAIGAAGAQLERVLGGRDLTGRTLRNAKLVLAPDAELEHAIGRGAEGWELRRAAIRLTDGLGWEVAADEQVLALVRSLDGRPLRAVLASVTPELREDAVRVVAGLLELGFLVADEDDEGAALAAPSGRS